MAEIRLVSRHYKAGRRRRDQIGGTDPRHPGLGRLLRRRRRFADLEDRDIADMGGVVALQFLFTDIARRIDHLIDIDKIGGLQRLR